MKQEHMNAAAGLAAPPEKKEKHAEKKIKEVHVRKAANRGYIAKHIQEDGQTPEHVLRSFRALAQHLQQHIGQAGHDESPEEEQAEPSQLEQLEQQSGAE